MQVTTLKASEHQVGRKTEESGKYLGRFELVRGKNHDRRIGKLYFETASAEDDWTERRWYCDVPGNAQSRARGRIELPGSDPIERSSEGRLGSRARRGDGGTRGRLRIAQRRLQCSGT